MWVDLQCPPAMHLAPARARCLLEQVVTDVEAGPIRRVHFPLAGDSGPLGVIEIDQFKQVNDRFGHTAAWPGDAPASAFAGADRGVHQSKGDGRNRVVSHAAMVAQGLDKDTARDGGIELF